MLNTSVLLDVYESLARRCGDLGVWLWCVTPDGTVLASPSGWPAASTTAGELAGRVAQLPPGACDDAFAAVAGGVYALRRPAWRGEQAPYFVWLAWRADQAGAVAPALGVGTPDAAALANGVLTAGVDDLARLTRVVRGLVDDVTAAARNDVALAQFGDHLSQAHEEVNVLFRVAGLLKGTGDARQSLGAICDQMQQTLGLGWMAVRFGSGTGQVAELAGVRLLSGEPRCGVEELDRMLVGLLAGGDEGVRHSLHEPGAARVLMPETSPLAAASGSEVVAQPIVHDGRPIAILVAGGKDAGDPDVTSSDIRFIRAAAELIGVYHGNVARFEEQRGLFLGTLRALTASIDAKDPYTRGHSERVALLVSQMAEAIGLDAPGVERFRIAGLVHDVGKIGVPEAVLCKCGRLDEAEFAMIKRHPEIGHGILKDIPGLADLLPGVLHHHERWDGRGYPHGLAGDAVPLVARVLALADTFDAMSSDRSYRKRLSREHVLAEIRRCAGTQFDAALVPTFTGMDFSRFDAMLGVREPTTTGVAA